jgi:hypothetical protein
MGHGYWMRWPPVHFRSPEGEPAEITSLIESLAAGLYVSGHRRNKCTSFGNGIFLKLWPRPARAWHRLSTPVLADIQVLGMQDRENQIVFITAGKRWIGEG